MYTSGVLKTLSFRRKDDSNNKPGSPSAQRVNHIANCMRQDIDWTGSVLILDGTSSNDSRSRNSSIAEVMESDKTRYKLWPQVASGSSTAASFIDTKEQALAAGRSATSLSDTAIIQTTASGWPPRRGGSLLRRRNISVPELSGKDQIAENIMQPGEYADSPTIPGRPPLKKTNSDHPGHERSASAPGNWRESPFSVAILSSVAGPAIKTSPGKNSRNRLAPIEQPSHFNGIKPLSPIFSPTVEAKTPLTAIPRSPSRSESRSPAQSPVRSPARSPTRSPAPLFSPECRPENVVRLEDVPPPVPPKDTPSSPIRANTTVKRTQSTKTHVRGNLSFGSVTEIPPRSFPTLSVRPTPRAPPTAPTHDSPTSKSESSISPKQRVASPDLSMMDKSKPKKNSLRKQRSAPALPRAASEVSSSENKDVASGSILQSEAGDEALPMGLKPTEAVLVLPNSEKDIIRKQAIVQAEQFEILGSKLVTQLSRELRALDERCEYLRKTYKSLRAGRQKLHSRMIAYLKSDSLNFSKERLLKQQEALIELDASIDDWITKLERAENRRLRLRQKLLEHVAASMTLSTPTKAIHSQQQNLATPPRSPLRSTTTSPESVKEVDRKDVESIKIYADSLAR
ncbi:hypothetical protein, variant [Verruconis gallopava]|uniref:Up-regulated during septation protein 1 domain-containing protein n=1 Tax=Verruconis gallopava TaxID=253628 RepID=A0A0D2B4Z3_9PEZI|nr:hypothetical protein, variant [Verruconis gallopava]KIW06304.1 hypothetical protein, variant [Verruconis gallopava]